MKAMNKQLVDFARVSVKTLMSWLKPHMKELEQMDLKPNAKGGAENEEDLSASSVGTQSTWMGWIRLFIAATLRRSRRGCGHDE